MATGTITAMAVWRTLRTASLAGVEPALVPTLAIEADDAMEARVPIERFYELWAALMRATREPGLPMRMVETITSHDYDPIGFACMTRATLGEALQQALRFARVWRDAGWSNVTITDEAATLEVDAEEPHLGARVSRESMLAELLHGARTLTGVRFAPLMVRFRHDPPPDVAEHQRFFGGPIEWSAPRTELVIDAKLLNLPLVKADPALAAYFERHSMELLSRFAAEPDGVEYRLRRVLAEELRAGEPTLEAIAPRLAMSARTLRRRLQEAGTSYREVLDATRAELAKRYLADAALPVGAVSFMLGFSEPSTFHRAFKRWTGMTPAQFRKSPKAPDATRS
jgi:AraC-like DNA-binding protein